jgi:hypothetical protein
MGKVPIRLKEVTYMLSPFQQSVMGGLWKDLPHKAAHHAHNVSGGGTRSPAADPLICARSHTHAGALQARDAIIFCVAPLVGIAYYCSAYVSEAACPWWC